jgi:HSP20 family molecular chaperone IbpA
MPKQHPVLQVNSHPLCAISFIVPLKRFVLQSEGKEQTSAKWRRSNKTRKWSTFNNFIKPKKTKTLQNTQTTKKQQNKTTPRPYIRYAKRNLQEPTPLIDIFQDPTNITIVAEIAGFNKETFKIHVKDQKITLSAKSKDRRYYKSLNLPKVVIPNAMHTKYKHGVLEIKLQKAETIPKEADKKCHIN